MEIHQQSNQNAAARPFCSRNPAAVVCCAMALLLGDMAAGMDASSATNSPILNELAAAQSKTHARLLAGVWIPRLGGDTFLDGPGGGGDEVDLDIELDMDDIEPTANFELLLAKEQASIHISGFSFSTSNSGTFTPRPFGSGPQQFGELTLRNGDPYRAELDLDSVALELQMNWLGHHPKLEKLADGEVALAGDARLSIVPTVAGRWAAVDQSIESAGMSEQVEEAWLGLLGGVAIDVEWLPGDQLPLHAMRFQAAASIGPALGGDGGFMWHVRAGLNFDITPQLSAMFGYRLLELEVENDAYLFEAGLQGLFLAGSYRF